MNSAETRRAIASSRSGSSVMRALASPVLASWRGDLSGTILDIASGNGTKDLRRMAPRANWIGIDIAHHPDVLADATRPLPIRSTSIDVAVLSWFLYVARDPCLVLAEAHRVLRPGGVLILTVPLVFPVNPEPNDFWRFTGPGVDRLLGDAGFGEREIAALGGRWCSAAYLLEPFLRPRRIVMPAALRGAMALDRRIERRLPRMAPNPAGYCARAIA